MKIRALLSVLILGSALGVPLPEGDGVVTDYHGTKVEDPFRFFEDKDNASVQAWAKETSAETFGRLAAMPDRAKIAAILDEAGKSQGDRVGWISEPAVDHYFFTMRRQSDEIELLFEQKPGGKPELVLDPRKIVTGTGAPVTVKSFSVSPDLDRLAVSITSGGGENAGLYVIDLADGDVLEGPFERARWGAAQWLPDSTGFFYNRLQKLGPDADPLQTFQKSMVHFHRLGTPEAEDRIVFGMGIHPGVEVKPEDIVFAYPAGNSGWMVSENETGVSNDYIFHITRLEDLVNGKPAWRKLTDRSDLASGIKVHGEHVYLLSRKDAPNGKIVRMPVDGEPKMEDVFKAPRGVILDFAVRKDGMYLRVLDGGPSKLLRLPWNSMDKPEVISMPEEGKIWIHDENGAYGDREGVSFTLGSWTRPSKLMRVNGGRMKAEPMDLPQLREPSISEHLTSRETTMPGLDGVAIPVSISHRKDLGRGPHPVMLIGYGAYGMNIEPSFSPQDVALFEMGGIKVVAHVRGGGELGDEWRLAGNKKTKPNTWRDMIAVARGLVKEGIAGPKNICIQGRSAGGITAGRTLTESPESIGAAVIGVGCLDTVRAENTPNGIPNIPEFGSVVTKEGFEALYEMSAYHHVKDGAKYPPVMLYHGANDTRVELWQSLKMAARLKEAHDVNEKILMRIDYNLGHGSGSSRQQEIDLNADILAFFFAECR